MDVDHGPTDVGNEGPPQNQQALSSPGPQPPAPPVGKGRILGANAVHATNATNQGMSPGGIKE
eukprot:10157246-Karenia_brevis.AAC.1